MSSPSSSDDNRDHALMSMRTALVMALALAAAVVTGYLVSMAGRHPAEAWLAALTTLGLGIKFFHWLIGT